MTNADNGVDPKLAELNAMLAEIRERVRARHPSGDSGNPGAIPVPDLLPILHARDAAYAKVASIGTVNPRAGGLANSVIQFVKRNVARAMYWHVREQVEFNRAVMSSLEAILTALEDNNRTLRDLDRAIQAVEGRVKDVQALEPVIRDTQSHWFTWRTEWERKLEINETQYLRSVADLQTAFQHRVTLLEASYRDLMRAQHTDFHGALDRTTVDIQKRLWDDMKLVRAEYERLIHQELRLLRQRAGHIASTESSATVSTQAPAPPVGWFDYLKFSERFRGSEEYVRTGQRRYIERFQGKSAVLDLGCGRGEFLELMREAGVPARGIEQSLELVDFCKARGLTAQQADLFPYLNSLPDASLDGIFCSQVVEHLPPDRLPELIRIAHAKLQTGGLLVIETPNPECLAIFATHFYLDPTHTRPIPPALLVFYFEEAGFGHPEVERFSPAVESMPSLASLPPDFHQAFFANLDYAVLGWKL